MSITCIDDIAALQLGHSSLRVLNDIPFDSSEKYSIVANAGYDNESIEGCDLAKKEAYALLEELQKTEEDLEDDEKMRFSMAKQLLDGTLTYEW